MKLPSTKLIVAFRSAKGRPFAERKATDARPAFTLLEMVLSLSIALVILGALYLSLERQFNLSQSGREVVQRSSLARAILTRIGADIQGHLGAYDPRGLPEIPAETDEPSPNETENPEAAAEEGSTTPPANSTTPPATNGMSSNGTASNSTNGTTSNGTTSNGADKKSTPKTGTTTMTQKKKFNLGVQGDEGTLSLSVSRMSRDMTRGAPGGDLRRINYLLVEGKGLARHEVRVATSEEARLAPLDVPSPESCIIAAEVKSIKFEYFNGSSWSSSWNGDEQAGGASLDAVTSVRGPPSAIAITIELPRAQPNPGEEAKTEKYRFVITLPAGNNFPSGGM